MNVLVVGGGSKWGLAFTKFLLTQGHSVDLITSKDVTETNLNVYKIDWKTINADGLKTITSSICETGKVYDLIFFNQTNHNGPNSVVFQNFDVKVTLDAWNQSYFNNCQLPVLMIKQLYNNISNETKIGWMITGMILRTQKEMFKHGMYASYKYTNQQIMRLFSLTHKGKFFVLDPGIINEDVIDQEAKKLFSVINNKINESGYTWNHQGLKIDLAESL